MSTLSQLLLNQWQGIRGLTYDYLALLSTEQLALRLPFETSQSLGYQFWCMTGAAESYLRKLETGAWPGFACSLDGAGLLTPELIREKMQATDAQMEEVLAEMPLEEPLANGQPAYEVVMQMIKHEMHHHGQLINFLYCHHLPIPASWQDEWALSYD
ncbi:MAG: DinB family protein [Caldilineaceae bacterium]|nr:DinB family protein [Caldilineaceae bacterium]